MEEQEMPMDEDYGEWAYQLELEQRYLEEEKSVQSQSILE